VVSFRNGKYSETYAGSTQSNADETLPTIQQRIQQLLAVYFTPEQLWRGVG
jgi:hypothetical protein